MMKRSEFAMVVLFAFSIVLGAYFYPRLPSEMVMHWSTEGAADSQMPKPQATFLIPLFSLFFMGLYKAVPKIDPLKENIEEFRTYFEWFIAGIIAFLVYLQGITYALNLGYSFNITQAIAPALAGIFYAVGVLLKNAERNWFIGLRTPWTLSSEEVWEKTHEKGSLVFKVLGVVSLAGLIIPQYFEYIILPGAVFAAVFSFVYSYLVYRRLD
ncbi:MAG: SdpI family protein [Candidatus Nanohaloarchaeota archaeon QJJ-9]|nr:SdpI family protein [Candidatus Nanohaloarchaeota archaeon QJJ-9]